MKGKSKKRKARTASQQRWLDAVAEGGSILSGMKPVIIHHLWGETAQAKIDLVTENVGQEAILPLTEQEHHNLEREENRRPIEKVLFKRLVDRLHDHPDRPSEAHIKAIMEYHR